MLPTAGTEKTNNPPLSFSLQVSPMFMLGNFLMAVAKLINFALSAYIWVVIARAVITWVNADPYNPIVRFLRQVTDPLLEKIRRVVPIMGGLDLSPMILILIIIFLQSFLVPTLQQIAVNLQ
jgi:YggT family protein